MNKIQLFFERIGLPADTKITHLRFSQNGAVRRSNSYRV